MRSIGPANEGRQQVGLAQRRLFKKYNFYWVPSLFIAAAKNVKYHGAKQPHAVDICHDDINLEFSTTPGDIQLTLLAVPSLRLIPEAACSLPLPADHLNLRFLVFAPSTTHSMGAAVQMRIRLVAFTTSLEGSYIFNTTGPSALALPSH
jgi:hypothetical protein